MKPNKNEYGKKQEFNREKESKSAGNESWKQGKSASSESWKKEKNKGEDRNNGSKYFNTREEE